MFHYCFLLCIHFFPICHFLLLDILFFLPSYHSFSFLSLITRSASFFYCMLVFSCLLLCLFPSSRLWLSTVLFCKKSYFNSFFLVLSSSWFFSLHRCSLCYDTTLMLPIVFSVLQAIFLFPSI